MMKKAVCILSLLLVVQAAISQPLIRRNSRLYVEAQSLPSRVEPMLTDVWNQYSPNNNLCPIDSTGQRCIVGCVATAMSQVMRYWEWPQRGTGFHEYVDLGTVQRLSSNFAEHVYDWDNMINHYKTGEYTSAQAEAIALLSSDCGIAVDMRYGANSSGARSIRQPMALVNYFGYDCGMQMYFRDFYSLAEITFMLKTELAAGRPVLVSGYNNDSGHAFVIDGYDEQDKFHIHVGNPDNDGDGWTYLPHMVPDMPRWYDRDTPENGMNILQMFVLGVMPADHPQAVGVERHSFAFQSVSAVTEEGHPSPVYERDAVSLTVHDLSNVGWNFLEDSVAVMLKRGDELVCPLYVYNRRFLLEEISDTTYTDTLQLSIPTDVDDGVYTIVPMYRDNAIEGGKEWREALTSTGTPNYLIADVQGHTVTLSSDTASIAFLTLEDFEIPDLLVNGTPSNISVTLKNHNAEMAGRLYILFESLDEGGSSFYMQRQGLTLAKDEVSQRLFRKRGVSAPRLGRFRVRLQYESNLFADELIDLPLPEEKIVTVISARSLEIAARQ